MRDTITEALLAAGFRFDPENRAQRDSGNESRYTIYQLPYEPIAVGEGALRPEIQIETAVWPLRRYAEFRRDMVYGDTMEYATCIGTLRELTEELLKGDQ